MKFIIERKDDELMHYGILGMKWGIRRYQNYDGSYTKEGLKRYRDAEDAYKKSKTKIKSIKENGGNIKLARSEKKKFKKELRDAYNDLEASRKADEGKKLADESYTVREIETERNLNYWRSAYAGELLGSAISFATGMSSLPISAIALPTASLAALANPILKMVLPVALSGIADVFIATNADKKIDYLEEYQKRKNKGEG